MDREEKKGFMEDKSKYFVVKQRAVPEVLLKVVEAKKLLETVRAITVQEAADRVGISRSSFYKYKDDIFPFYSMWLLFTEPIFLPSIRVFRLMGLLL